MIRNILNRLGRALAPRDGLQFLGQWGISLNGGEYVWSKNRVVNQGLDYILSSALAGGTPVANFYVAPFAANVTPSASTNAANFASSMTEFTNYTQANRQIWTPDTPVEGQVIENDDAPAVITVGSGAQNTIYGAGLLSVAGKGATSGILVAAVRLPNPKLGLSEGDELRLKYRLLATSA